jgi:16S rRNA (cytosine1402-N4)-methyltransferase
MAGEAVAHLVRDPDGMYVDGTVGHGGHAELIVRRLSPRGRLLVVDRDEQALALVAARLAGCENQVTACRDNFKNLPLILNRLGIAKIHGLLLDLGVSTLQLFDPERGFSFAAEGPLDMRMDQTQKITAAQLVNSLPEDELANLIFTYGEERHSRRIARRICEVRQLRRIASTAELATIVERAAGPRRPGQIHPATRTFQALRIAVNNELEGLGELLQRMADLLIPGGRLVVISFHSLEDRIVKQNFQLMAGQCICRRPPDLCGCPRLPRVRLVTRKPAVASAEELRLNPRARSARMRVVERV